MNAYRDQRLGVATSAVDHNLPFDVLMSLRRNELHRGDVSERLCCGLFAELTPMGGAWSAVAPEGCNVVGERSARLELLQILRVESV